MSAETTPIDWDTHKPSRAVQRAAMVLFQADTVDAVCFGWVPQAHEAISVALDAADLPGLMGKHRTWTERWSGSNERQYVCICGEPLPVKRDVLLAPLARAQANHQRDAIRAALLGGAA